ITPSSTNPQVTLVGDYIFRVCFTDPYQGEMLANFASENLKAKNAAILKDVRNDYSVGLAQFFTDAFTKAGGKIVTEVSYSADDKDFKGQLTKIKSAKPDVIFVPGYYTEAGLIAQQARELGLKQPLLGGDGWESPKLVEIGGSALDGSYYSNHYFVGDPNPRVQDFVTKYKAKYSADPDSIAALPVRWDAPGNPNGRRPPARVERPRGGQHLRSHRARLHDGLRRPQVHQLRPQRSLHGGRVRRLLPRQGRPVAARRRRREPLRRARVRHALHGDAGPSHRAARVPAAAQRAATEFAHHGHRRLAPAPEPRPEHL